MDDTQTTSRTKRRSKNCDKTGRQKKSNYPYIPKGPVLVLPPCKVCGGKASGIHYGVNSCEACKGFFRRYLTRGEPYMCTYGGHCEISDRHRSNCSACRMQKCLDLGMSKDGIKHGRYTLTDRTKVIIEVKKLQLTSDALSQPRDPTKNLDFISMEINQKTSERMTHLMSPTQSYESDICSDFSTFSPEVNRNHLQFSPDSSFSLVDSPDSFDFPTEESQSPTSPKDYLHEELTDFLDTKTLSFGYSDITPRSMPLFEDVIATISPDIERIKGNIGTYEDTIEKLLQGLEEVRPHSNLTDTEIAAILKEEHKKYHQRTKIFGPLNALSPEEYNDVYEKTRLDVDGRKDYLQKNKGTIEVIIKKYVNFSHKIPGFSDLPSNDQALLLKASRFEFFLLLEYRTMDPDLDMMLTYTGEVFHLNQACIYVPKEMMKSWLEFTRCIKKLQLTDAELAVVLAVALTFRDRCKITNPDAVEEIQTYLLDILSDLLEDHHGNSCKMWFTHIMDMFTNFRSLSEAYFHHFRTSIRHCQLIQEHMPEILEFAFDE
ncbi:hypothetical protein FSP39_014110 [Pinctada imbricata]|uniref:Uncharacterized protein n=1 Tax=Pinctada imbricata TaxID=66713 RepID=A0AA88YDF7_PINIB|nr:hypothetical protein FSP39_014110 [Pinctada imbricata]